VFITVKKVTAGQKQEVASKVFLKKVFFFVVLKQKNMFF